MPSTCPQGNCRKILTRAICNRQSCKPLLCLRLHPGRKGCLLLLLIIAVRGKRQRRDRPQTGVLTPGTSALTKLSPERATEHITCLISNCLYLCRPFGTFHVVTQLPGVLRFAQAQAESTPVCGLSRLDFVDLWFGAFPRTTIILNTILSFLLLLLPVRCSLVQRLLITQ